MKNILNIIFHDFKRLTSSVVAMVILMGIIVIPCLFAWFNILSNWDPFEPESTGRIPVAVATEDKGTEMLGMSINVGEKFIDAVNGNDMIAWDTSCDKEKAIEGVSAGDFYAAVIIPEDFSANVMSFSSGEMRHPKILFYENEKKNAIAPKITGKVREVLEEEIDQTFVETLGQYLTEAASAAEAAGLDPQDTFSNLSSTLTTLSTDLESSVVMLQSASGLSDAAQDLLNASDDLIDSSQDTLELGEQLIDSAEGRVPESANAASIEKTIDDIAVLLEKDLGKLDTELSEAKNDMGKYNRFVQDTVGKRIKLVEDIKAPVDKVVKKLNDLGLTGLASRFDRISDKLGSILEHLNELEKADENNWTVMQKNISKIQSDIEFSQKSIARIEEDLDGKLDKKLNQAVKDARASIDETRDSLAGIYGDMELLEDALDKSGKSLKSLNGGLAGTVSTLASLQDGSRELAALFDNLSGSEMLQDVNHLMTNDASVIAENMASPIKMETEEIYPIDHFGSVMTPFYNSIAQWVGALFAAVMIHVHVRRRKELEKARLHEVFFGRYRLFLFIGLAQALLLSLGELLYVGIQCLHPGHFVLATCVNSVVFTLIVYSLVFALENMGLAVSVIAMILQVAGGGGTFPVEVLPPVFRALYPLMPFQYSMNAMRECIGGMYGNAYFRNLGTLLLFGLAAILFGLLMHKPLKGLIEKVEESKRESDVML